LALESSPSANAGKVSAAKIAAVVTNVFILHLPFKLNFLDARSFANVSTGIEVACMLRMSQKICDASAFQMTTWKDREREMAISGHFCTFNTSI
jgi:hypothetical protein